MTLWSGRFAGEPDEAVFAWGSSFGIDRRLFEDDVRGSLAWAEELARVGVLCAEEHEAIGRALEAMLTDAQRDASFVSGADEDVHAFVERQLVARVGERGKRLHTGRSRNEQVALDLRMYLKRRIPIVQASLGALVAAFADRADEAGAALMPAYTHLRRAQPILEAHYWLAHASAMRRACTRFDVARDEADAMPLGSGAVAGNSYGVDPARLAGRLGFSRIVANSVDATADRDFVAAFLHACALAMLHVSRLSEDVILFSSEEFGFFDLDDRICTGSSLMPQKKNPDPMELARGKAGRVIGRLAGWLATAKGLPSGYNKDLQEDKEAVFDAEDTLLGCLLAVRAVVSTLRVNRNVTGAAVSGLLLATDVADYLVAKGMPFREAHETVGGMVRSLVAAARSFENLGIDEWQRFSPLFDADIVQAVSPQASVAARTTPQSTAPQAVAAQLADVRAWLFARGCCSEVIVSPPERNRNVP
ncbi:MAG: argininosuccinate lyase [Luteitalea sp.]|nr:argininosuccinate lyase [Luteitalea sp.]